MSRKISLILILAMTIPCFSTSIFSAVNISTTINTFSDGSSEFNAAWTSSKTYSKQGISIQSGLWIDNASFRVSTASLGGNAYPVNVTLDVGGDGNYEWAFNGPGYGPFGNQNLFLNNREKMSISVPANGGTNTTNAIRLPYGASVQSATMNITSGGGMGGSGKILLACADTYDQDVRSKLLAFPDISTVDIVYTMYETPTLDTLKQYSSVLIWSNYGISDPYTFGDNLADYVDLGGGVVLAVFTYGGGSMGPQGRFSSNNDYLVIPYEGYDYSAASLGTIDVPDHPIMQDVDAMSTQYYRASAMNVVSGATKVASWNDGRVLVGTKNINGVERVDLGFFPPSSDIIGGSWDSSTDGALLMHNALAYAGMNSLNVTFDLLNDGQVEYTNESLSSSAPVNIPDFAAALNGYLSTASPSGTDGYGNSYVDIPVNVTATTSGALSLLNLSIKYEMTAIVDKNPSGDLTMNLNELMPGKVGPNNSTIPIVIYSDRPGKMKVGSLNIVAHPPNHQPTLVSFEPSGPQVMDENSSISFIVSALDIYGNPLTYQWFYDGVAVEGMTGTEYTLETDFNDAGTHTVAISVMNGLDRQDHTWDITVLDVNRAPVITGYAPQSNPTTQENQSIDFGINATDPDGDAIVYSWTLDGKDVAGANRSTYSYRGNFSSSGDHSVVVTVRDAKGASAGMQWGFTVENTNVAPYIADYSPKVNPRLLELESARFSVTGTDPDNQSLSVKWYVDGTQAFVGTTYTYKTNYNSAGLHEVKVIVSDGTLDAFRTWKVTVDNVNRLPISVIDTPTSPEYMLNDIIKFSAKSSSDIDMDPLNFTWKEDTVVLSNQMEFERTFGPGIHTVTLYVVDAYGGTSSTTVRFRVRSVEIAGIIGLDKLDLTPGDKVNIIATLSNIGDAPASNVNVEILVDGTSLGSKTLAQLNAGASYRETFGWKAGKVGNHTVVLKVGEQSWQRTIYVDAKAVETTDTAAGLSDSIGMGLIIVVMVVLLAFGYIMMRRK